MRRAVDSLIMLVSEPVSSVVEMLYCLYVILTMGEDLIWTRLVDDGRLTAATWEGRSSANWRSISAWSLSLSRAAMKRALAMNFRSWSGRN